MVRPNFTSVILDEVDGVGTVHVEGTSDSTDDDALADIVDIVVVLVQGDRIARQSVNKVTNPWVADVPQSDPAGSGQDFQRGEAIAFGVESRVENSLVITWTERVTIT